MLFNGFLVCFFLNNFFLNNKTGDNAAPLPLFHLGIISLFTRSFLDHYFGITNVICSFRFGLFQNGGILFSLITNCTMENRTSTTIIYGWMECRISLLTSNREVVANFPLLRLSILKMPINYNRVATKTTVSSLSVFLFNFMFQNMSDPFNLKILFSSFLFSIFFVTNHSIEL